MRKIKGHKPEPEMNFEADAVPCPKCDHYSSNTEVCDVCGALIASIQKRAIEAEVSQPGEISPTVESTTANELTVSWTKITIAAILLVLAAGYYIMQKEEREPAPSLTVFSVFASNFDKEVVKHSATPVLVDFHATWCGPCKELAPRLEEFAGKYKDRVKVVKVDIDRDPDLARRYRVRSVPTLILMMNGRELERQTGSFEVAKMEGAVKPHL